MAQSSIQEAERRPDAVAEVEFSAQLLERILDNLPFTIAYLDRDLVYRYVNARGAEILGHPREEIIGSRIEKILPQSPAVLEAVRDVVRTGEPYPQPIISFRPPGRPELGERFFAVAYEPDLDESGQVRGVFYAGQDVTELLSAQQHLEEERARLRDVLSAVSHDLRNPLAAILGQAQLLQRRLQKAGLTGPESQSVTSISSAAQRMNTMIQDLVDSTRSETGQLKLDRQAIDLPTFAHDLLREQAAAMETGRVDIEPAEGLPPVSADPGRLGRILTNLLSNALKYSSPDAQVTIRFRRQDGEVITSVIDRGVGIAPEDIPHLFDRYHRTGGARPESIGLGLYITRTLIDAHGGRIWVESEPGVGSTFYFSLPVAE